MTPAVRSSATRSCHPRRAAGPLGARRGRRHRAVRRLRGADRDRPVAGPPGGLERQTLEAGVHSGRRAGGTTVVFSRSLGQTARGHACGAVTPGAPAVGLASPRPAVLARPGPTVDPTAPGRRAPHRDAVPSGHQPGSGPLPVLLDPYGGPHAQRCCRRGTPTWSPSGSPTKASRWSSSTAAARRAGGRLGAHVPGDFATPVLEDQVEALHAAAASCAATWTLDGSPSGAGRSAATWPPWPCCARPDVFHAAVAGAPVTDCSLYDTHYIERYLGQPARRPDNYERCSLLGRRPQAERPLMLIHGLADDNVVVAHSLRLSAALPAAGRPHSVLPLTGVTHMASARGGGREPAAAGAGLPAGRPGRRRLDRPAAPARGSAL